MTKGDLIAALAEKTGVSKKDAAKMLEAFLETVTTALQNGDNVQITGFGTFLVKDQAARTGRNPRTGEPMQISARKSPAFKAGKTLKESVN